MNRPLRRLIAQGLLALAGSVACGCASLPGPSAAPAVPPAANVVKLAYRTSADRLNVAGAGTRLASDQQPAAVPLPGCSTVTLVITSPHPRGAPGYAEATVVIRPDLAETPSTSSLWPWLSGAEPAAPAPAAATPPPEVRTLDIPQWQVEAVVAKLHRANFFQRSKVLDADVFLAAQVGPQKIAKACKSLPELDAIILRSRVEGRLAAPQQKEDIHNSGVLP